MLTRRYFLQTTGAVLSYVGIAPLVGAPRSAWARLAPRTAAANKTLVVIFLRGGADGLNLVVPHGDASYFDLRKGLAVPAPGRGGAESIDLDGYFGLNPRLGSLKPLFDERLAVAAHAVGYDRNTRSHFEEQDTWETGVVGNTINSDGWLNRHLMTSTSPTGAHLRAVAIGDSLPRIMHGRASAFAIRGLEDLSLPSTKKGDPAAITAALEHAYAASPGRADVAGARDLLAQATDTTLDGVKQLRSVTSSEYKPAAEYPKSDLARKLMQIARLIKAGVGLEVAEVDIGGWDTHQNQGRGGEGQLGNLAQQLGDAIAAFTRDLGDRIDDTLIVTMTDFGRTAAENGTGGTDHGWANCMFLVGGAVRRGHDTRGAGGSGAFKPVVTDWPGLAPDQLHQKRDLLHTTDFRDVLGELVATHLGNPNIRAVLPEHEFKRVGLIA